jgi:hypothetical protein
MMDIESAKMLIVDDLPENLLALEALIRRGTARSTGPVGGSRAHAAAGA